MKGTHKKKKKRKNKINKKRKNCGDHLKSLFYICRSGIVPANDVILLLVKLQKTAEPEPLDAASRHSLTEMKQNRERQLFGMINTEGLP
ncbi:hypothetical protein X975_20407, partial [Stegodyphus mimosarum]